MDGSLYLDYEKIFLLEHDSRPIIGRKRGRKGQQTGNFFPVFVASLIIRSLQGLYVSIFIADK